MCTLAIHFHRSSKLPLVVAANRDEFYARRALPPRVISVEPWVVGGQDLNAGGTWFGVNEHDMIAAVLNRRHPAGPDPRRRSRGLLCLEALQTSTPGEAAERAARVSADAYNPFNLLVCDPSSAYLVTHDGEKVEAISLPSGVHVLTNRTLNDPSCRRIVRSSPGFRLLSVGTGGESPENLILELQEILADHGEGEGGSLPITGDGVCVHSPIYGTVSSSVALFSEPSATMRYWFCDGPPCTGRYRAVALPESPAGRE